MRTQPFDFQLISVCPAGHATEFFAARIDPLDTATVAAAEARMPAAGVVAECGECGGPCDRVRTVVGGEVVEEVSVEEFNRRAVGKAPPRNYG